MISLVRVRSVYSSSYSFASFLSICKFNHAIHKNYRPIVQTFLPMWNHHDKIPVKTGHLRYFVSRYVKNRIRHHCYGSAMLNANIKSPHTVLRQPVSRSKSSHFNHDMKGRYSLYYFSSIFTIFFLKIFSFRKRRTFETKQLITLYPCFVELSKALNFF